MSVNQYATSGQLEKLSQIKIGIAGAGGLGSNCASHLVRSGVKRLKIVDFDIVSASNLNRQFFFERQIGESKVQALAQNLGDISADIELELLSERVSNENVNDIFEDCDIVVEAFDNAEAKELLIRAMLKCNKVVVTASGMAGVGRSNSMQVNEFSRNLVVVGDCESGVDNRQNFPWSPRVGIAAAMQANCVVALILGEDI